MKTEPASIQRPASSFSVACLPQAGWNGGRDIVQAFRYTRDSIIPNRLNLTVADKSESPPVIPAQAGIQ